MKELKLIDRVVVEIKGEEGVERSNIEIANELRHIAERIENGIKGDNGLRTNPSNGLHTEVLWEHECTDFGFQMGDKSLICKHYYGSEPKDAKYIIIAHNYDRENSDAYPVDGRLFTNEEAAKTYLREHINDIKSDHWTADRVDGEDDYSEEFTCTGWEAHDSDDGASLELTITQVMEE